MLVNFHLCSEEKHVYHIFKRMEIGKTVIENNLCFRSITHANLINLKKMNMSLQSILMLGV